MPPHEEEMVTGPPPPQPPPVEALEKHPTAETVRESSSSILPVKIPPGLSLIELIQSKDDAIRDLSLSDWCWAQQTTSDQNNHSQNNHNHSQNNNINDDRMIQVLLEQMDALDAFVEHSLSDDHKSNNNNNNNLYETVRALFFLYALHRFHLKPKLPAVAMTSRNNINHNHNSNNDDAPTHCSAIPYAGYQALCQREFAQAISIFGQVQRQDGPSRALSSALARAYYQQGFQTLANQVRCSVQQHDGNAWMFVPTISTNSHHHNNHDYRHLQRAFHPQLLQSNHDNNNNNNNHEIDHQNTFPVLCEQTPVRMDLSHCGWSDIFFLGMDYPAGARVLNVSINLAVRPSNTATTTTAIQPQPPIATYLQVLPNEPVLRLTSIDLKCTVTLTHLSQVFDFGQDYLGLLKAGVIAAGIVPPALEAYAAQCRGNKDENDESGCTLAAWFAATLGPGRGLHLTTAVRDIPKGSRLAVSTNLLGSIISLGMRATQQTQSLTGPLTEDERRLVAARAILGEWLGGSGGGWQDSGGLWPGIKLIQGVPPRPTDPEYGKSRGRLLPWHRQLSDVEAPSRLVQALQESLVLVHGGMAQNVGPVLEMVTEKYLLRETREWQARQEALHILDDILDSFKRQDVQTLARLTTYNFCEPLQTIIPWASNLYTETLIERARAHFGPQFWGFWMLGGCSGGGMGFIFDPSVKEQALQVMQDIMLATKREMETAMPFAMDPVVYDFTINDEGTVAELCPSAPTLSLTSPAKQSDESNDDEPHTASDASSTHDLDQVLQHLGFDQTSHEVIREDYRTGKIGLRQNRLPSDTKIANVGHDHVTFAQDTISPELIARGQKELEQGTVAVVSLAAGVGSRWTEGAGCVKALHPFCKLGGKHRSFVEVHLAKSRAVGNRLGMPIPHVFTTSHMTHTPLETYLKRHNNHGYQGPLYLSPGKSIGLRLIPTASDLKFAFQEKQQQKLDVQAQKVRESAYNALIGWAQSCGEANDYRDNLPLQCLHPVGHYYEIPNLILNGTLKKMLEDRPQLKYLMLHNIDTVGADVDPGLLGLFATSQSTLSFEVIPREIEDIGGGLAQVDGKTRIVEGLALPNDEDEFKLTYYNSMTTWIDIDKILETFDLSRECLDDGPRVSKALSAYAQRLPTYVTLKDVKKRWGNGQEDIFPTAQFEKLWSDLSSTLDQGKCDFVVVPRVRGAQLKEQAQLDGWLRDGSSAHLETLCCFEH